MKSIVLLSFSLLHWHIPLSFTAFIPSTPLNLDKRAYDVRQISLGKTKYRPLSQWAEPVQHNCTELVPREKYLTWPLRAGPPSDAPDYDPAELKLCTVQNQIEASCDVEENTGQVMDQSVNDCPETLEALVQRVMENSADGRWEPVIDEEEARRGLRIIMPEVFEDKDKKEDDKN